MTTRRQKYRKEMLFGKPTITIEDIKKKFLNGENLNKKEHKILQDYIISLGWEFRHLFMRGNQYSKDDMSLIYDSAGYSFKRESDELSVKLTKEEFLTIIENGIS